MGSGRGGEGTTGAWEARTHGGLGSRSAPACGSKEGENCGVAWSRLWVTTGCWYALGVARLKKHPGRKRRIVGRGMLTLALLVAVVWAASGWWWVRYSTTSWEISITTGILSCSRVPVPWERGWKCGSTAKPAHWNIHLQPDDPIDSSFSTWNLHIARGIGPDFLWTFICLWPLPLLLTVLGLPVLVSGVRARRRAKAGSCPACGYDRRGLAPGAVCPECGKGGK
jgi:hypothetical protein